MAKKHDVVTVVREDGKEFVINRNVLAEHINRGFTVTDPKDRPSEEELSKAVGYRNKKRRQAEGIPDEGVADDENHTDTREETEVPEEQTAGEGAQETEPPQRPAKGPGVLGRILGKDSK